MRKPIAVCISDIHFNINNLEIAAAALLKAQFKAKMLNVPLIVAGDLLDNKSIIRAECMNRLLQMFSVKDKTTTYVLVGNHDLCNEKSNEHSLNFLWGLVDVITPAKLINIKGLETLLISYQNNSNNFINMVSGEDFKPRLIIAHQGSHGAFMGEYIQDKTSIHPDLVKDFKVISGHYHRHQTIGTVTYIGSPFTHSFAEANDGPKGFLVLFEDGSFEHVPTNLRKHVVITRSVDDLERPATDINPGDIIMLKIEGPLSKLKEISKKQVGEKLFGHSNFKLDLISTNSPLKLVQSTDNIQPNIILTKLIDISGEDKEHQQYLKEVSDEVTQYDPQKFWLL